MSAHMKTMLGMFGRIEILAPIYGLAKRVPDDDLQFVADINLRGTLLCARHAREHFRARTLGEGIIVSPVRGFAGDPECVTY